MTNQAIICPNCGKELTAAFTKRIEEKLQLDYEARLKAEQRKYEIARFTEEREQARKHDEAVSMEKKRKA